MAVFAFKPMPKKVHDLVDKLLAQKDFYPDADPEERKRRAWAVANKQLEGSEIEGFYFTANEPSFTMVRGADGSASMLMFKNAVLARAERNRNRDVITEAGIGELAATIAGWPIDVEHGRHDIVGMFTTGRAESGSLLVDGAIWADRYPDEAQGVMDGAYELSVEARAERAKCSTCGQEFTAAKDYCEHLANRHSTQTDRTLFSLKARGGALTKRPAGSDTRFDQNHLYIVASHHEVVGEEHGQHDDSMMDDDEHMDDEAKKRKKKKGDEHPKSDEHPMKESIMDPEKLKQELDSALAKITALEASLKVKTDELATRVQRETELIANLQIAQDEAKKVRLELRRSKLGTRVTDEQWQKNAEVFAAMPEPAFELMASFTPQPDPKEQHGTLPVSDNGSGDRLTLK